MPTSFLGATKVNDRGFTYAFMLLALIAIGLAAQAAVYNTSMEKRRHIDVKIEQEGQQFIRALESYWHAVSIEQRTLPRTIDQLLLDPRFPFKRHLRRQLQSPYDAAEWAYLRDQNGHIYGAFLNSEESPTRRRILGLDGSELVVETYSDWQFIYEIK